MISNPLRLETNRQKTVFDNELFTSFGLRKYTFFFFFFFLLPIAFSTWFEGSLIGLKRLQENIDREGHDVEQTEKMIPSITSGIAFRQHVCELLFGINVFDLDFGVQIDSVKQPIKRIIVDSGPRVSSLHICL